MPNLGAQSRADRTLCSTSILWFIESEANDTVSNTSYLISDNVVYLVIADKSYPRKLAFSYLDELSKEFALSYGPKVEAVRKPYAFVGFGASYGHCLDHTGPHIYFQTR